MEIPYLDDEASSPMVRMMKGLRIPDPDPNNDILGVATVLKSGSKIKVPDFSNPFNLETI